MTRAKRIQAKKNTSYEYNNTKQEVGTLNNSSSEVQHTNGMIEKKKTI